MTLKRNRNRFSSSRSSFGQRASRSGGANWSTGLLLLGQGTAVTVGLLIALDFLSFHRISGSAKATLENVTKGAVAGEVVVIGANRDAEIQKKVTDAALATAQLSVLGDQVACGMETIVGGVLTYVDDPQARQTGSMMTSNCAVRQQRIQGVIVGAGRGSQLPELRGE